MHQLFAGLVLILAALLTQPALAQEREGLTITGGAGFSHYDDDRNLDNGELWSIGAGYRFQGPMAIEFGYLESTPAAVDTGDDVDTRQWRVDGLYHFGRDSGYISPFVSLGVGHGTFDYTGSQVEETLANVGVGAKVSLSDAMAFRTDLKMFRGNETNANDFALIFSLHYAVGKFGPSKPAPRDSGEPEVAGDTGMTSAPADSDGDGVPDSADQCAGTPAAVAVDSVGCPRDSDNDGVADYEDSCPGTSDPGARIDARGCYETLEETKTVELDVKFDLDSAETRSAHQDEVERVYEFMRAYPETRVTVEGHTDSTGAADYNQDLSQRRAEAIAQMLIDEFGVEPDRVSAVGYGEAQPIAPNETSEGRQQNRRVVAIVEATVEQRIEAR